MKRKNIYILFTIILILSIASFLFIEYKSKIAISENLMIAYFSGYKASSQEEQVRLLDYKYQITGVSKIIGSEFVITVKYSVKPFGKTSNWYAGNGVTGADGWIQDKYIEVTVEKESGKYLIKSIGIG